MSDELNKCGCGDNCGCNDEACGCEEIETLVIDLEDENGNIVSCPIIDQFSYEEKEYVLAQNQEDDSVYMFRVELDGEEETLVVPEEEEFDKVSTYYNEVLVNA